MKKRYLLVFVVFTSCFSVKNNTNKKNSIHNLLDNWHLNAANTNFDAYFDAMSEDAVFMGTDATENWNKKAFMTFAKPYFEKGKAWSFTSLERNIYFSKNGKTAWFDELLNTQMKICRGSGVLIKEKNQWKIKQYVLSMTIPNENTNEIIKIKSQIEDKIIEDKINN